MGSTGAISRPSTATSSAAALTTYLTLHQKLAAATIPADKALYQRQIDATDRQIDALAYELYGLMEEEIAIVEGI